MIAALPWVGGPELATDRARGGHARICVGSLPAVRSRMLPISADMAFSVGLFAGWLALVVWLVWPDPHCACCAKRAPAQFHDRRF